MHVNRRRFLESTLAGSGLVALGLNVPAFLSRTALAAGPSPGKSSKETILVVVELTGGNDGLNTVIPFKDPEYAKLRPTLAIPRAQVKKLNDDVGLHPSLAGLAELHDDRSLCVVQGVGYPNPSQSHFRSMDVWQAASTAETLTEGWLGKALKSMKGSPSFHLKSANQSSPLAFEGATARVPSIASLEDFQLQMTAASGADKKDQRDVIEGAVKAGSAKPGLLDFVSRTAANTYASSKRLQEIGKNYQPKVPYPQTPLASRLKLAAQLIDADLGGGSSTSRSTASTPTPPRPRRTPTC